MPSKRKSSRTRSPASKTAKRSSKPAANLTAWNRKASRVLEELLEAAACFPALRKMAHSETWQAGVRVVSSPEMRKLNSRFRGKDHATDVLSFVAPEPFSGMGYLGELVIALPVLKRQARELGHSESTELAVLLSHGLLHLLGFDHEKGRREAREQSAWEQRLLALIHVEPEAALITRSEEG